MTAAAAGKRQLHQQAANSHFLRLQSGCSCLALEAVQPGSTSSACGCRCRPCCSCFRVADPRGRSSARTRHSRRCCAMSSQRAGGAFRAAIPSGVKDKLCRGMFGALFDQGDVLVFDLLPQCLAAAAPPVQEDRLRTGSSTAARGSQNGRRWGRAYHQIARHMFIVCQATIAEKRQVSA